MNGLGAASGSESGAMAQGCFAFTAHSGIHDVNGHWTDPEVVILEPIRIVQTQGNSRQISRIGIKRMDVKSNWC